MTYTIRTLGIDQGIANCGYALMDITIKKEELNKSEEEIEYTIKTIDSGVLLTEARWEMANRVFDIYDKIDTLIDKYKPDIIGCEQLFLNNNSRSIGMLYVNMATGILYALSGKYQIPLKEFVPGTVKKNITGHGQASKEDVIAEIESKIEDNHEKDFVDNEHIADAFGIGLTAGINFFKNYEYYKDIKESIKYKYTSPEKRKPIKLLKSEKTKLDKLIAINNSNKKTALEISKDVNIPKPTVEKYLIDIENGELDYLLKKQEDQKNGKLDKYN